MSKRAGILGFPLRHTISPIFQQAAFDHLGLDVRYLVWETPPAKLAARVRELAAPDVVGFNVTVPHKEAICPLLDGLADEAMRVGAVNTVVHREGHLIGDNTDTYGFLQALVQHGLNLRSKQVLLLGAGGAARAVLAVLAREGVASVVIANRTLARARELAEGLKGRLTNVLTCPLEGEALALHASRADLIVNCTSMGMRHGSAESETPLAAEMIPSSALVYDLVYNPPETPLLRAAMRAGASTLGGLPMLVYQGARSFELWTGQKAPVEVMFRAAQRALTTGS
ncbi:MAG: shikimate dehydrogenase [Chloroflexi bacterium]|nr:shikimate dehydrogenase [Chloroflexota bacterium]